MSATLPVHLELLADTSARLRPIVDAALDRYASFDDDCPSHLAEAIRYSLLAPGKRLRPQLVLMAAEACGGTIDNALPAACAVEMIHAYSLVHDDLPAMDDDDLRRGRPTCHKVFGEAVAILVGDALQARAFELIATQLQPSERAAKCSAVLAMAAGACALVGGQAADLAIESSPTPAAREYCIQVLEAIHRRKTGALFIASLEMGGITAGASPVELAALVEFGAKLGLAFQIVDDLLDATGNQSTTGKRVAKDAEHGKLTFPILLGVENSRSRANELLAEACTSLEIFGERAAPLRALAQFVAARDN
jgi:geranylgeranyl diphosphate synthase type II